MDYGANSFVPIDEQPIFEGNIIVRLVFQTQEAIYSMSIPTISTVYLIVYMVVKRGQPPICSAYNAAYVATYHN